MCGRFVSSSSADELSRYFDAEFPKNRTGLPSIEPNFNVAPTDEVFVVFEDSEARHLDQFRWGLVPRWAKDRSDAAKRINARVETIATNNVFRRSFVKHRCIVPAAGFYEWTAPALGEKKKAPWFIHRADGELLAFAGVWELWWGASKPEEPPVPPLRTCTILTCPANEAIARLHNRMPVLIPAARWSEWLDPANMDTASLQGLLVPCESDLIRYHRVGFDVNSVRNNGAGLSAPVGLGAGLSAPSVLASGTQLAFDW